MNSYIKTNNLFVKFYSYTNRNPSLKASVLSYFLKREDGGVGVFDALQDINLNFTKGERVGIIGKNGAGKSTLLKVITGIYPPTMGEVEYRGKIVPLLELGAGFDLERTAKENIYLNGAILGISRKEMKLREEEISRFSELGSFLNTPLKNLSSGMISRLAFSVGASLNPEILILDEVFAAGDANFIKKARSRMLELIDASHILLFVSHQETLVRELCNRVVVLERGKVVFDGKPNDAYAFYNSIE